MRRVVITGIGLITPVGIGVEENWSALTAGKSGIAPITRFDATAFDTMFAGEVKNWDGTRYIEKRKLKELARFSEFAVAGAVMAWEDSGLGQLPEHVRDHVGGIIGTGIGGIDVIENTSKVLFDRGPGRISPYFIPSCIANMAGGQAAMRLGLRGVNYCTTSACASGAHAIGESFRTIQRGEQDIIVCGGAEGAVTQLGIGGFNACKALSKRNAEPERASRPWDKDRDGFVMGEGAGIVVLEERERAVARGAKIYAEMLGYGASDDAFHITQPAPEGEGGARAMAAALADARIDPDRVGDINAHGTSTDVGDVNETKAIKNIFGAHARSVVVSSTKSMTGHLLGAAGSIELAYVALAVQRGVIPPTINLDAPGDGCDLDYAPHTARELKLEHALSNSFGFGGTNTSLIVRRA